MDGNCPEDRLDQIEPVIEDWHALMCVLKVCLLVILKVFHVHNYQPYSHPVIVDMERAL